MAWAKRFLKVFKSRTFGAQSFFACDLIQFQVTPVIVLCIMFSSSLIRNMYETVETEWT